jgi:putative glutamine amidotransferase
MHRVGDKYIKAIFDVSQCAAVVVPAMAERHDFNVLIERLDGVFLTGSASNVEPHHYDGARNAKSGLRDSGRDNTTLPLIRAAIDAGLPIFAVCRGIQELNVALGGTLHQMVHELPGKMDHRMNRRLPASERFGPRHRVDITPYGLLHRLNGGADSAIVNSAHAQSIDRPANRLNIEAVSEDGVIEAVSVKDAKVFALGVQWHPEHPLVVEAPLSIAMFNAFGDACRTRARQRISIRQPTRAA